MKPMMQPNDKQTTGTSVAGTPDQRASERPRAAVPAVDVYETGTSVVIIADVPGVDQDGIEMTVDRGVLTLRAKSKQSAPHGFKPIYQEYLPTDFERQFTLSDAIDSTAAVATVSNGVLRIELPKAKQAVPRKIAVTAA